MTQHSKTGRTRIAALCLLPLLAACNATTTSGDRSGLQSGTIGEHGAGPLSNSANVDPGPTIPVPESRVLGDAFEPKPDNDGLSTGAHSLPERIRHQALQSAAHGKFSEAAAYYALLYYRNPHNEALAIKYAEALRRSGVPDQALAVLKPFAEPESASPDALIAYAKANLQLKRLAAAVQAARWAVDADPNMAEAYHVLGVTLDAMGKHGEAQAAYQSALAYGIGDSHRTLNNLAMSYAQTGQLQQARASLEQAQELDAGDQTVQANLQLIRTVYGQKQMKPTLDLMLPTRLSDEPVSPERHPTREWPLNRDGENPRAFMTGNFDSFDRLTLPRMNRELVRIEKLDDMVTINLPANISPNLPTLTRALERSVDKVSISGDGEGIALAFRLRPEVAIAEREVDDRIAIDFLISPATRLDDQTAAMPMAQ